jgi:MoaA/NifB/PqqE/SkfB family radical SAM enzyme
MKGNLMPRLKVFSNKKYRIIFEMETGTEILSGINGNPDPFCLELPSLLDIGIMGTCGRKCAFCYQGHINQPNMTLSNFKLIIDQVKYHVNQVALGGRGDPNKHRDFKKILEYCRKNNVVPNYTTSGFNLTDKEIEISKLCGAVAVSDYDEDYTYDAIRRFIKAGIKTNIHKLFSRSTYDDCLKILLGYNPWKIIIGQKGISSNVNMKKLNAVVFLLFKPQGAGKNIDLMPTPFQIKRFSELIYKSKAKCKVGMDSCLVNHTIKYVKLTPIQKMSVDTCEGARMSAYITPDLRFMPCSFANHNTAVQITGKNIKELWDNGHPFKTFRNVLSKTPGTCPIEF